ncbi:hypothetical protein EDC94DRAFT_674716 [Helicostylum pulchrum]|nr:hypothetical protein EDC94DRAFT_674716 [Helicostylum pulchrum]
MSPYTKKPSTRDSVTSSAVNSVPAVSTSVSKVKLSAASAKKHATPKLVGISRQATQSQTSSVTRPVTRNTPGSPVLIPDDMESTFDSDIYHLDQMIIPTPQLELSTQSFEEHLPAGLSEWLNEFQSQISVRFESQNSRIHNVESLLQENAKLKETVAEQASVIAELRARLHEVPETKPLCGAVQFNPEEKLLRIWIYKRGIQTPALVIKWFTRYLRFRIIIYTHYINSDKGKNAQYLDIDNYDKGIIDISSKSLE